MQVVTIGEVEVGILTKEEFQQRTMDMVTGKEVERPDIKVFAASEEEAPHSIQLDLAHQKACSFRKEVKVMQYFGIPMPGNSWLDGAEKTEPPVGALCHHCREAITKDDCGYITNQDEPLHNACFWFLINQPTPKMLADLHFKEWADSWRKP